MNIFHVVFFIINYYYLYRKPLCNKVIMPIFLGNSNISYKENKNSITPYNALLFKNQRVGIGVNINSILNNSLEVNGDINIPSSSTYKINNANFGYSNLDHKLLAGTNISIGADFKVNNTYTLPAASGAVIGGIRVGNNLSILDGVLSAPSPYTLPTASDAVIGGIRVGNNLSIDANSILSVPSYTLPISSDAVIGGIRVGANLSITDGVLSAPSPYTLLPTASTSVLGGIRVDGTTIAINAGVISYTGGIPQWGTSENNIYNTNTLNVGIGTSNPQSKLHILEENSSSSTCSLIIQNTNNSIIELIRGTSSDANRDFKIGNYDGNGYLYGYLIVKSSINGSDSDYIKFDPSNGDIYNFNNSLYWTQTSDRRIKENIEIASYDKCYENIDRLELKRFNYIKEFKTRNKDTNQLGFIAQEIKDIFPKSVFTNNYNSDELNIPDMHSIDMGQINYTLFGAVKKLMEINYDEEMRLKRLEDLLNIDPNTSNIEVTESVN